MPFSVPFNPHFGLLPTSLSPSSYSIVVFVCIILLSQYYHTSLDIMINFFIFFPFQKAVTFTDWFQLEPLQEYHKVILAEDFMKYLAPKYWPKGKRKGYCWLPYGSKQRCVMKEGFPFKAFWDELGVDFDDYIIYHTAYNMEDPYVLSEWMSQ